MNKESKSIGLLGFLMAVVYLAIIIFATPWLIVIVDMVLE